MSGLGARMAALAILSNVLRNKRPLDVAIADALGTARLEPRDAGFARAIASMSLRRFGQLEALIRQFVAKPPPPHKAGPTLEILVAGACELLFLNVAAHAAVDGANRLAQADSKAVHFKGLINAVLRRISREGAAVLAGQNAAEQNTPDWLWPRWVEHHGADDALCIAESHLGIPPLDLVLKTVHDPLSALSNVVPLAPRRLRLTDSGRIEDLPGFRDGAWWVQDFAASLPAHLFGDVAGKRVIDLCAAPGGKTLQLAAQGAVVTALDLSAARLALIAENLARTGLRAELIAADVRDWRPAAPAELVLLDAPCTATGTIRRHPDLPWLKSAADIGICEALQAELLDAAAAMTAPGGTLIYAVCSLEPEEGEEQIDGFLRNRPDFVRVPVTPDDIIAPLFISPKGDLRTMPFHWAEKGGMDGFYAARLTRGHGQ